MPFPSGDVAAVKFRSTHPGFPVQIRGGDFWLRGTARLLPWNDGRAKNVGESDAILPCQTLPELSPNTASGSQGLFLGRGKGLRR